MGRLEMYTDQIVLADDDPDHGLLFKVILRQIDPLKQLLVLCNGNELIDYLSVRKPCLLFLDLHMPCKNGYECLDEIRQYPHLKSLPVVVYSSSSQMPDIKRSFIHKADLYLVKPFNSFHLRNALESILKMDWLKNSTNVKYYFMNNRFVPFTAEA
jgi:CheY-like chemotaxis protein